MVNLSVGVIGAGAVGCFYAAQMAKKGAQVTIITRHPEDYDETINIQSVHGNFLFKPVAIQSIHEPAVVPFDVVLLATKALPIIDQVALVQPFMSKNTKLMVIQNGIFIESDLLDAFSQPIFRCLAFICVSRKSKNLIHHMDFGSLSIGCLNGQLASYINDPFFELLRQLEISVRFTSDIHQAIWEKLIWNAPFNPLSVVYNGATTEQLLNDPAIASRIQLIMKEVQKLAAIAGHGISDKFIQKKIDQTRQMVPYKTSMCLDHEAGLPIESEAILGNVIQFAQYKSIDVPEILTLYQDLQKLTV